MLESDKMKKKDRMREEKGENRMISRRCKVQDKKRKKRSFHIKRLTESTGAFKPRTTRESVTLPRFSEEVAIFLSSPPFFSSWEHWKDYLLATKKQHQTLLLRAPVYHRSRFKTQYQQVSPLRLWHLLLLSFITSIL